ncbi:hypothetical protein BX600DRAFT_430150 [Xylariales sp. PMI_506]|nr:hypothetical protein BX600DRAFT_430150 [Xylariales sp. PMI_506]
MTDASSIRSSRMGSWVRNSRGQAASRNPSGRISAVYNEDHPTPGYGSHVLRSSGSRFSLNEQFSTTRREIDFGFDDAASSIFDTGTIASKQVDRREGDDIFDLGLTLAGAATISALEYHDFYELLCLPSDASPETIRRAYFRLFIILYPDTHSPKLRPLAKAYFSLVQTAFEILINPESRLTYDLTRGERRYSPYSKLDWYQKQYQDLSYPASHRLPYTDHGSLGFLVEMATARRRGFPRTVGRSQQQLIKPLQFSMDQTFTAPLPELGSFLDHARCYVETLSQFSTQAGIKGYSNVNPIEPDSSRTFFILQSSVAGFMQDLVAVPTTLLANPAQPSIPTTMSRAEAMQILDARLKPMVAARLIHRFLPADQGKNDSQRSSQESAFQNGTVLKLESEFLPYPSLGVGVMKQITLPRDNKTSIVNVETRYNVLRRGLPTVGMTVQQPVLGGALQCKIDSGDWLAGRDKTCHEFTKFSYLSRGFSALALPLYKAPTVELSYKTQGRFRIPGVYMPDRSTDQGLQRLDWSMEHGDTHDPGSWTVSTTAEPLMLGTSLIYSADVTVNSVMSGIANRLGRATSKQPVGTGVRVEAEMSINTGRNGLFALRCLKRLGRFTKLGLEIGLSAYNMHVSLYWSRLGQRFSLPFLICPGSARSLRMLFWTTCVPVLSLVAWELVEYYRRLVAYRCQLRDKHQRIQARRAEADDLTLLMSTNVDSRQDVERTKRGLVVLSAKYGVKTGGSWALEEVADVTTAVAALVDNGSLRISPEIDKSNILGFWDPIPGSVKTLHVRYQYQGHEGVIEVEDQEGVVLPPSQ